MRASSKGNTPSQPIVGVDARLLDFPGIGRYIGHLLLGLSNIDSVRTVAFVRQDQVESVPGGVDVRTVDATAFSPREQVLLRRVAREARVRLVHSPHFNFPLMAGVPRVITIHDLAQLRFPGPGLGGFVRQSYARFFISTGARAASAIITDSQFIQDEVVSRYAVPRERIFTIPLAVDLPSTDDGLVGSLNLELPDRFFLYVGTNKPWKNLEVALRGLAEASESEERIQLVIAGKQARNQEPLEALLQRSGRGVRVQTIGTVTEAQLAGLYQRAVGLLCPSIYEGFGLTALEGLRSGTPVIHSGAASLSEVVGPAGLRADPYDPSAWSAAALSIWRDAELRARLSREGRERASQFTIDRMTARTVDVYRRVIRQG